MPSNCTIISWKGKKEMASLLKGSKGGAFQYSRRGLRLRRRGAYGIHRASGPRCQGLCRKVASLRSGGRRLAVRTVMEHSIGALPRTPFPASRDFPSRGNEKIGGTGYCVTYDTDSQSRNVLASPLGEEGHEVAKGWTVVILIMILDVDVTAEGGIIKLIARRAIPPPFEPFEPYEPSEPSQRRCVQWHSRIGGGERSEPVSRMVIITYDTER